MKLMRITEVAEMTGVPVATLRYWRHLGTGPESAKLGRAIVYRREVVEAWIDEQFAAAHRESA